MNAISIIEKYYKKDSDLYKLLVNHSTDVMIKALKVAEKHPELSINSEFVKEAAMLHDIGIILTDAPTIHCNGISPYICHGYLGREILDILGYPAHALVCERHTGTGLDVEDIIKQKLPLPHRDLVPISIEEKVICYADCFFSKTNVGVEKTVEQVRKSLAKHGEKSVKQFDEWHIIFG